MSSATTTARGPARHGGWLLPLFFLASAVVHVVGFWSLSHLDPGPRIAAPRPVELVMFEVEPAPEPEPEPVIEPEPEPEPEPVPAPPPPRPVVAARPPPPVETARPERPVETPPDDLPPPPNDAPPPEPSAKPPPLVVGISMSSTSSAGDFAAPVGNTVYGRTATTAENPEDVRAYQAPERTASYVPVYEVDRAPMPVHEVRATYPREARVAGVEGSVILSVSIAEDGTVSDVRVVKGGLGYGLEAAAQQALYGYRFSPATRQGKPVSTTIRFTYTWLLD